MYSYNVSKDTSGSAYSGYTTLGRFVDKASNTTGTVAVVSPASSPSFISPLIADGVFDVLGVLACPAWRDGITVSFTGTLAGAVVATQTATLADPFTVSCVVLNGFTGIDTLTVTTSGGGVDSRVVGGQSANVVLANLRVVGPYVKLTTQVPTICPFPLATPNGAVATIDFDGLDQRSQNNQLLKIPHYQGFSWSSVYSYNVSLDTTLPAGKNGYATLGEFVDKATNTIGTVAVISSVAGAGSVVPLISGVVFDVTGVLACPAWRDGITVTFSGSLVGNVLVTQNATLVDPFTVSCVVLNGFTGIDTLTVTTSGGGVDSRVQGGQSANVALASLQVVGPYSPLGNNDDNCSFPSITSNGAVTTIGFDSLDQSSEAGTGSGLSIPNGYQGLNWNNVYSTNVSLSIYPPPNGYATLGGSVDSTMNITGTVVYTSTNGVFGRSVGHITPSTSGQVFDIVGVLACPAWLDGLTVNFVGHINGANPVAKTITLVDPLTVSCVSFTGFTGIYQLDISTFGGTIDTRVPGTTTSYVEVALANFQIVGPYTPPPPSPTPVPEVPAPTPEPNPEPEPEHIPYYSNDTTDCVQDFSSVVITTTNSSTTLYAPDWCGFLGGAVPNDLVGQPIDIIGRTDMSGNITELSVSVGPNTVVASGLSVYNGISFSIVMSNGSSVSFYPPTPVQKQSSGRRMLQHDAPLMLANAPMRRHLLSINCDIDYCNNLPPNNCDIDKYDPQAVSCNPYYRYSECAAGMAAICSVWYFCQECKIQPRAYQCPPQKPPVCGEPTPPCRIPPCPTMPPCQHPLNGCSAASPNTPQDLKCSGFSEAAQADLMAMSGNVYNDGGESEIDFQTRYNRYICSIGGVKTFYMQSPVSNNPLDPDLHCGVSVFNESPYVIAIVCRGTVLGGFIRLTADPGTVSTDINFLLPVDASKHLVPGLVHGGFYMAFMSAMYQLDYILSSIPASFNLYCTGHSSGGAIAAMMCIYAKTRYSATTVCGVYTFAAPKYGDQTFANNDPVADVTYRYELPDDPVPQLPFEYIDVPVDISFPGYKRRIYLPYVKIGSIQGSTEDDCQLPCDANSHFPSNYCNNLPYPGPGSGAGSGSGSGSGSNPGSCAPACTVGGPPLYGSPNDFIGCLEFCSSLTEEDCCPTCVPDIFFGGLGCSLCLSYAIDACKVGCYPC